MKELEASARGIRNHNDLVMYRMAFDAAMRKFELSRGFPPEEEYSLTDRIRRSSRSVGAHLAEAWRRRRCQAAFTQSLNRCEAEAAETQVWLEFAYLDREQGRILYTEYDHIIGKRVNMINHPESFLLHGNEKR